MEGNEFLVSKRMAGETVENKIMVVTGSASGIGREIVMVAARSGITVVIADISVEAGERVRAEVEAAGGNAIYVQVDVSSVGQVKNLFEKVGERFGGIDILVNCAGVPGQFSLIVDMADETWHKTLNVHLNGTFYCLREAARYMIAVGFGRIINIASIAGIMGTVGSAEYSAAKAAVINLTKTAAKELGRYNITVNAIAPGMVATPVNVLLEKKSSPFIQSAVNETPTARMTEPGEIADLVLFLSSHSARNITGQVISVDGGALNTTAIDNFMSDFLGRRSTGESKLGHR
jgi:3-oxoacyl-[acyl-carrier protein] reductase